MIDAPTFCPHAPMSVQIDQMTEALIEAQHMTTSLTRLDRERLKPIFDHIRALQDFSDQLARHARKDEAPKVVLPSNSGVVIAFEHQNARKGNPHGQS